MFSGSRYVPSGEGIERGARGGGVCPAEIEDRQLQPERMRQLRELRAAGGRVADRDRRGDLGVRDVREPGVEAPELAQRGLAIGVRLDPREDQHAPRDARHVAG